MSTWLGPASTDAGPLSVGPVVIDRWSRRPHRTLLVGAIEEAGADAKVAELGLEVTLVVSKGSPIGHDEENVLFVGARLAAPDGKSSAPVPWFCPCDVRFILLGRRADHARTIRWVFTPENNELFFGQLPLDLVEKDEFLNEKGSLRLRAELWFHWSRPEPCLGPAGAPGVGPLPIGAHGAVLTTLAYAWCLAGPEAVKASSAADSTWRDVGRGGCQAPTLASTAPLQRRRGPDCGVPVPGLLPPCSEIPSAYAQEVIPGLLIASRESMSKLLELHDVGVRTLFEIGASLEELPRGFAVRLLTLRGAAGDAAVELVEEPARPEVADTFCALGVVRLIEASLEHVLSGGDGACQVLVLPRDPEDEEPCAAVVAAVVGRRFRMALEDARRYVQTRWDVAFGDAWWRPILQAFEDPKDGSRGHGAAVGGELANLARAFRRASAASGNDAGDAEALSELFASWFAAAKARRRSEGQSSSATATLRDALEWDKSWQPCLGTCFRVHDSGWGSVSEIFRALRAAPATSSDAPAKASGNGGGGGGAAAALPRKEGSLVTLRLLCPQPHREILEVPNTVDFGKERWHLVALICASSASASAAPAAAAASDAAPAQAAAAAGAVAPGHRRDRFISFLRGGGEMWMLDGDSRLHSLSRREMPGAMPENWLCTSDMCASVVVYVRSSQVPAGTIPVSLADKREKDTRASSRPVAAWPSPDEPGTLAIRVATEKALQQSQAWPTDGLGVAAAATLRLAEDAEVGDLREQVHAALRIPPSKQLLLRIVGTSGDAGGASQRGLQAASASSRLGRSSALQRLLPVRSGAPLAEVFGGDAGARSDDASSPTLLLLLFDAQPETVQVDGEVDSSSTRWPILCRLFDAATLRCPILGVLLMSPSECLLRHVQWIRSRFALACGRSLGDETVLACSVETAAATYAPVRMDWPLCEQDVRSGSALVFETSPCGRRVPAPALDGASGSATIAMLSQLLQRPPPVSFEGCMYFDADVRNSRSFHERISEHDLVTSWTRLFCEDSDRGDEFKIEAIPCSNAKTENVVVFRIIHDGDMGFAAKLAQELSEHFAALGMCQSQSLSRDRFILHKPRALFLTTGTARDGLRYLWHSNTSGCSILSEKLHNAEIPFCEASLALPTPLRSILKSDPGEIQVFEVFDSCLQDDAKVHDADRARRQADALLSEEPPPKGAAGGQTSKRSRKKQLAATKQVDPSSATSPVNVAPSDTTTSNVAVTPVESDDRRGSRHTASPTSPEAISEDGGQGPSGASLPQSECAAAEGKRMEVAENSAGPPCLQRRTRRLSTSSSCNTPGTSPTVQGAEDAACNAVRKSLLGSTEQLVALLSQAKALGLNEDINKVERQLLPIFLLRRSSLQSALQSQSQSRDVRSTAMSRSSSCDSFLEEPAIARESARLVLASGLTPGEATQPSTPRSLVHTPGSRPLLVQNWPEQDAHEGVAAEPLEETADAAAGILLDANPAAPSLPIISWHEPYLDDGGATTPTPSSSATPAGPSFAGTSLADPVALLPAASLPSGVIGSRHADEMDAPAAARMVRRRRAEVPASNRYHGGHVSVPGGVGFLYHSSPFNISRTPNIRTPASHCSPARSPTSISGYCSPITGLPSGVASPSQRRSQSGSQSQSGYSSPSGPAFFAGTAQSGLMRRLMSLREAREEKEDGDACLSSDGGTDSEDDNVSLLDFLLQHAHNAPLGGVSKDPQHLHLDLDSELLEYSRRGLVQNRAQCCLNAMVQALLVCSPLMHLFAQLSQHELTMQRPAYSCLVQVFFQFFKNTCSTRSGAFRRPEEQRMAPPGGGALFAPFDANPYVEPLLRRFERWKATSMQVPGPLESMALFTHFVFGQLHDECKWPTLSPLAGHYEDSPVNRIFGGLMRSGPPSSPTAAGGSNYAASRERSEVEAFLVLRLELAAENCTSVEEAIAELLRPRGGRFLRLPPFLVLHLQRFRVIEGVPTKVSRPCRIDTRLALDEATSCMLRSVGYVLCSAVCHYGEALDGGAYKALASHGGTREWYVFDDSHVRQKPAEDLGDFFQGEGYHVCFLMYKREDTKTVNIRPHAV
eukprot:TRINITY_DN18610_c0_g1_i1.p1 TRINITY_DN18610_c0_g1~~TRINITY_DN18610_c0_g1_i1.p1  ORF type:complete len:2068 (-),score=417.45 TRINITY_DN18610_c0_g1_i1:60-6263(-)